MVTVFDAFCIAVVLYPYYRKEERLVTTYYYRTVQYSSSSQLLLIDRCDTCTTPCRNAESAETPPKATRFSEPAHHVCVVYLFVGDGSREHVVCKG